MAFPGLGGVVALKALAPVRVLWRNVESSVRAVSCDSSQPGARRVLKGEAEQMGTSPRASLRCSKETGLLFLIGGEDWGGLGPVPFCGLGPVPFRE